MPSFVTGGVVSAGSAAEPFPRIVDLLETSATRNADQAALIVTTERIPITYAGLLRLVDNLATQLRRSGLRPHDRAALRAYSNPEFVVGLLAASRAGVIVVPLDPALPVAEQHARMAAAGARVVLVDADDPGEMGEESLPCWPISVTAGRNGAAACVELDTTAAPLSATSKPDGLQHDDALIMFTGGTTGPPKMVPWTHENISRSIHSVIDTHQLGPRDATVAVMPLYHGHGLIAALLATLASGGTVLLPDDGRFAAHTFWDDIQAAHATWYTAVPTIHHILLQRAATDYPGSRRAPLRFIRSCSAALSPEAAGELQATFAAPVLCAYGMTEATHQITSMTLGPNDNAPTPTGVVGQSTGVEIQIVGDAGRPCPPDAVGEVWVRGCTVVRGYLGNPAVTAKNFTDGWLHTGDLGSLSSAGDLILRGRIKELINRGGEKVSPERVEGVLASHPDVVEAAVFGIPDLVYGESVAAVIVPGQAGAPTGAELADYCRARLAAFEVPGSIQEADALPHTAKGSVDRRAVAAQFGRGA